MHPEHATLPYRIRQNIRKNLISGILVSVPAGITFLILRFFYGLLTVNLNPVIRLIFGALPEPLLALISLVIFLILIYLVGLTAAHVMGKQLIIRAEDVLSYIPFVKDIYHTSKQVIATLSSSSDDSFKSVVLIEYPRPGIKSIGFKTGSMTTADGTRYIKVMVPTSPNPTSGFLVMVPADQVEETTLTLDQGMKAVISGGILMPDSIDDRPS